MTMIPQAEAYALVARIRKLVERFGGQSDELTNLRKYYKMFHDCPEAGAFVMTEVEVERLEKHESPAANS